MNESAIATNLQGNTREVKLGISVGARRGNYFYHNEAQNLNPSHHLEVDSMPIALLLSLLDFYMIFHLRFSIILVSVLNYN
jgi:hypothetical protein